MGDSDTARRGGIIAAMEQARQATFNDRPVGAGSGRATGARAYALIYAGIHGAEDYGTITTYLRLQGLVPPSTALVTK